MDNIKIYNSRYLNYKVLVPFIILTALPCLKLYKPGFDWFWFMALLVYLISGSIVFYRFFSFKTKVLLEISEEGIDDRYRKRVIKWADVYNLTLIEGAIIVILHNPETLRPKSWWGKIRFWWHNWCYGSPVFIYTDVLKGKELDNYNILYDYMEAVERNKPAETPINASP